MTRRLAAGLLVVLSFLTRLPALLNADGTNSDAAVVGLQARHILHGQWSPFLWGSGYQTSADSTWAALCFVALGKSALALMLSALVLYVALTLLVFATLARHTTTPARAFVATLPLVFTTACVHSYALYPPRQLALTLAFAALFAIDGEWLFAGGLLGMLGWVADPYAAIFVPAAFVLALLVVLRTRDDLASRGRAMARFFGGAVLGAVVLVALFTRPGAQQGVSTLSTGVVRHNFGLLVHVCLPWTVGLAVYKPLHVMDYVAWAMPRAYRVFAITGTVSLVVSLLGGLALSWRARRLAHLAAVAWLTLGLVLGAFLVSVMVMDQFSMRYLAAGVLVLPFAIAPLVEKLGWRSVPLLVPYLAVAVAGGWLSHGDWVHGPLPVRTDAGRGVVEKRVLAALEERHVEAVIADYWASYRLAFLWREALAVVPLNASQDRYPPYRATFARAKRVAYVHDRDRSLEDEAAAIPEVTGTGRVVERFAWEGFDVVVIDRDPLARPR